jgi:hypothetical protein
MTTPDLSMYYGLFTYLEYGSYDDIDFRHALLEIKRLLSEKYGATNFRVKFLDLCILKHETKELDIEDREWIRYILHANEEPEPTHTSLLDELEELMANNCYPKRR